jgi:hypothetical protein
VTAELTPITATGDLCAIEDVDDYLDLTDDVDLAKVTRLISAISELMRETTGCAYTCPPVTEDRVVYLIDSPTIFVRECVSATAVADKDGNALVFTSVPSNGEHLRWLELEGGYTGTATVTGTWGFASIPERVRQACVLTVAMVYRRDIACFANGDSTPYGRLDVLPKQALDLLAPDMR